MSQTHGRNPAIGRTSPACVHPECILEIMDLHADVAVTSFHLGGTPSIREPPMIHTQDQRLFGYARVSTSDQDLHLQVDALLGAEGVAKDTCTLTNYPEHERTGQDWQHAARRSVEETRSWFGVLIGWGGRCVIW